jgi:hypothetical protein
MLNFEVISNYDNMVKIFKNEKTVEQTSMDMAFRRLNRVVLGDHIHLGIAHKDARRSQIFSRLRHARNITLGLGRWRTVLISLCIFSGCVCVVPFIYFFHSNSSSKGKENF